MFTEKVGTILEAEMNLVNNNVTDIIQSFTEIHNDKLLSSTPKKSKVSFTKIREMETTNEYIEKEIIKLLDEVEIIKQNYDDISKRLTELLERKCKCDADTKTSDLEGIVEADIYDKLKWMSE